MLLLYQGLQSQEVGMKDQGSKKEEEEEPKQECAIELAAAKFK